MVKYHPDTRYLTDFASGSLSRSLALCVSAHLHYCPKCRRTIQGLTNVGAALFERLEPVPVEPAEFSRLLARIPPPRPRAKAQQTAAHSSVTPFRRRFRPSLPLAIQRIAGGDPDSLKWCGLTPGFRYYPLDSAEPGRRTSLFAIKRGGKMPWHRHNGEEVTVVLQGSFSDQEDHYHPGDFIVRGAGEKHRPVAAQHEDCLCLTSLEAPIAITNWWYRLLGPLNRLKTACM